MALIDIIIPAYNAGNKLINTVNSIIKSGLENYTIIIINDGSTDNTGQVCAELERNNTNIKCLHIKNGGVSAARNLGVSYSSGEYVMFLDADDSIEEDSFSEVNSIILSNYPELLFYKHSFDFYHHGKYYCSNLMELPTAGNYRKEDLNILFEALYSFNALTPVWNKIYRRDLIGSIRFREDYYLMEDLLFSLECFIKCKNAYFLEKPVYKYHIEDTKDNTITRLKRIESYSVFITPFIVLLHEYIKKVPQCDQIAIKAVLDKIYYVTLRQLISVSNTHKIQGWRKEYMESCFAGQFLRCQWMNKRDKWIFQMFEADCITKLWLRLKWWEIRDSLVRYVKRRLSCMGVNI